MTKKLILDLSVVKTGRFKVGPVGSDVTQAHIEDESISFSKGKPQSFRHAIELAIREHFEIGCPHESATDCATLKTLIEIRVVQYCQGVLQAKGMIECVDMEEFGISKETRDRGE